MDKQHDIRLSMTDFGVLQLACKEHPFTWWIRSSCWKEMAKQRRKLATQFKLKTWNDD